MKKLPVLLVLVLLPIVLLSVWMNTLKEKVIPLEEKGTLSIENPSQMKAINLMELNTYQPDIVLLGNSMVGRNVNHLLLQSVLKRKVSKFALGGSSSRWWYLMTKNVITKATPAPKVMVLFFRDQFLTDPKFRLNSANQLMNEYFYEGEELLVQELSYDAASAAYRKLPIYDKKHLVNQQITDGLKKIATQSTGVSLQRLSNVLDKSFDESKMIEEIITAQQLEAAKVRKEELLDFDHQIDRSFLPHIIQLTKDRGIQLVLVRIKARWAVLGKPKNPKLTQYIEDMNAYLKAQNVPLMDYTDDDRVTLKMYAEGDHLSEIGMNEFTKKIFAGDLEKVLMELGI